MKKKLLGLLFIVLVIFAIFLYNLGQRPEREYPSFPISPEKNAGNNS